LNKGTKTKNKQGTKKGVPADYWQSELGMKVGDLKVEEKASGVMRVIGANIKRVKMDGSGPSGVGVVAVGGMEEMSECRGTPLVWDSTSVR
jgi:hypothetical protein